jgi:hypothetical protein
MRTCFQDRPENPPTRKSTTPENAVGIEDHQALVKEPKRLDTATPAKK